MVRNSPTALRLLKTAMNAVEDGQAGLQMLGGDATMLFYNSEEGNEVWSIAILNACYRLDLDLIHIFLLRCQHASHCVMARQPLGHCYASLMVHVIFQLCIFLGAAYALAVTLLKACCCTSAPSSVERLNAIDANGRACCRAGKPT